MKVWPLPDNLNCHIPHEGEPGSFWEDRGDRHHSGIDLYADFGSPVVAIESGIVKTTSLFTNPDRLPYWNTTYEITIQNNSGQVIRYAELGDVHVKPGQNISAGDEIGCVGQVINLQKIDESSPAYIQKLKITGAASMLHLEMYSGLPAFTEEYLGGNFFQLTPPVILQNPSEYLSEIQNRALADQKNRSLVPEI